MLVVSVWTKDEKAIARDVALATAGLKSIDDAPLVLARPRCDATFQTPQLLVGCTWIDEAAKSARSMGDIELELARKVDSICVTLVNVTETLPNACAAVGIWRIDRPGRSPWLW
jgi:hypothetical protein